MFPHEASITSDTIQADPMVRLFNRGTGTFVHGQYRLRPGFGNVPESVAAIWLAQYPDKVIAAADAETSGESSRKELTAVKLELEAAKRRIVDLEEELKRATRTAPTTPAPVPLITPLTSPNLTNVQTDPVAPIKIVRPVGRPFGSTKTAPPKAMPPFGI